jgi:molybdate transport system substrate-binding protein
MAMTRTLQLAWFGILSRVLAFAMLASLAGVPRVAIAQDESPVIACASDLQFALDEIGAAFKRDTGIQVRLSFGSSGNFARQIEQGAPFQMFLSADESFVFRLADKGLTRDRGALYAVGRIVLFAPTASRLTGQLTPEGLKAALAAGAIEHFAIANPEHAPYGRAAQQWLQKHGLWESLQSKLILGENASQAAQFATVGGNQGGIIPYSLALSPKLGAAGSYKLLSADDHLPLQQRMVLLKSANATAERFYAYMQSAEARTVMRRFGFALPGEKS